MIETLKSIHKNAYAKKGIDTDGKLIRRIPFRYKDYSNPARLKRINFTAGPVDIAVPASIVSIEEKLSNGKKIVRVKAKDLDGTSFSAVFMNRKGVAAWISAISGRTVLFMGVFKYDPIYGYSCFNPTFTDRVEENLRIVPVYHKIKNVAEKTMISHIDEILSVGEDDTVPEKLRPGYPDIMRAFQMTHHPNTMQEPEKGERRIILDDLVYFKLMMSTNTSPVPSRFRLVATDNTEQTIQSLPYKLTNDQDNTVKKIIEATRAGKRISALVQGDVGCGKTIIAFLLMICAAENGYQSIMMAPTQILAMQHYQELSRIVPEEEIVFYDGNVKASDRNKMEEKIRTGEARYIVGTSAILTSNIPSDQIAVAIVDEEHRFGVRQRNGLLYNSQIHVVTMSATPIPRSLATAIYGEGTMVFQIMEKPAGRLPVLTYYDDGNRVDGVVYSMLKKGMQAYVVCPLKEEADEESAVSGLLSAEEVYEHYNSTFGKNGFPVGLVTGDTKPKDKDKIIGDFKDGKIKILVSTTVIEVGINVPNANIIVIQNAERFGLATMHQLRGRVGRGNDQGYCILVSEKPNSRINVMCSTNDGFRIAEEDLMERRSGDLLGDQQSGKNYYVEAMLSHPDIFRDAEDIVSKMNYMEALAHMRKYEKI